MVGVLASLKWTVLRRTMNSAQFALFILQIVLALGAVALTILAAYVNDIKIAGQLVSLIVLLWTIGWMFGPMLYGTEDRALRSTYFKSLPLRRPQFSASYAVASCIGVTVPATFLALSAIVVLASRFGPASIVVSIVATLLQLCVIIFLGRSVAILLRRRSKSHVSALVSSLITGLIVAFFATGWWALGSLGSLIVYGVSPVVSSLLHLLPTGWAVSAVEAMATGDWLSTLAFLAGLLTLAIICYAIWSGLIFRRLQMPEIKISNTASIVPEKKWHEGGSRAVVTKELLAWRRDYTRAGFIYFSLFYSIALCIYPLFAGIWFLLPYAGVLFVASVAASTANMYAADGTGFWQTLITPGAIKNDIQGRQRAWLITIAPIAAAIMLATLLGSGVISWFVGMLGLLIAVLGIGAGINIALSTLYIVPMRDPQRRGADATENGIDTAQYIVAFLIISLLLAPLVRLFIISLTANLVWLQWVVLLLGIIWGSAVYVAGGYFAKWQLRKNGVAILQQMLRGEPSLIGGSTTIKLAQELPALRRMSVWQRTLYYMQALIAALLMFPQGLVPAIFKLTGNENTRVWFYALYLPEVWQWPVIGGAIAMGIILGINVIRQPHSGE